MARAEDMKTELESGYQTSAMTAAIDLLFITFLFCVSFMVTNPLGDFPLNDDWSFGLAVKHMVEYGDFRPTGWTTMPLISHVFWGFLFSIPVGFSFSALRVSTLTLSLLGVFANYFLMRELRQSRWLAVLASVTLAFSPVYYALSHTFMTDVPHMAIIMIASVLFVRNLRTGSDFTFILGTLLAVAATLSRQLAISIPLAFSVAFILKNGTTMRNILRAAIPSMLCIGALLVFQQWLSASGRLPALYFTKSDAFVYSLTNPRTIVNFARNAYVVLQYLGLFLLPVLIFVLGSMLESHRKKVIDLLILSTSLILMGAVDMAVLFGKNSLLMPNSGNIIIGSGIGPLTLRDTFYLKLNDVAALPSGFWLAVTVLSLLGAVLLITAIGSTIINLAPKLRSARMVGDKVVGTFLLLSAMIYLFPLLVAGFFDRYLLPAMPFLAAGIASSSLHVPRATTRVYRFAAVAPLLALTLFAVCGTRDYLAWNRSRWEALHDLMENKHVKAENIDGGFEFNGWYSYDAQYKGDPKKSGWWVQGDMYRIGFGNMPGYKIIKDYTYVRWLPPHAGRIVVLKENLLRTPNIRGAPFPAGLNLNRHIH